MQASFNCPGCGQANYVSLQPQLQSQSQSQVAPVANNSRPSFSPRKILIALNVSAAIFPALGYMSDPSKTSFSEMAFDVFAHSLRAISLITQNSTLISAANYIDGVRLALIAKSTSQGNSTFPGPIVAIDTALHTANVYKVLLG